jgi:histone deacetylase HOS3
MKKVKITLVSKAQREARERDRAAKEQAAKAEAATKPSVEPNLAVSNQAEETIVIPSPPADTEAPVQGFTSLLDTGAHVVPQTSGENHDALHTPVTEEAPVLVETPAYHSTPLPSHAHAPVLSPVDPRLIPLPGSPFPATPLRSPVRAQEQASAAPDLFVPYQPEGPSPAALLRQQQTPLQWVPPNTSSTPTVAMRRVDLPVFTPTSTIPFGPRPGGSAGMKSAGGADVKKPQADDQAAIKPEPTAGDSVWEIPETPQS